MDTPLYSEDTYPEKFINGQTIFPDDARIFHRPDCQYDDVVALGKAGLSGATLVVDGTLASGAPAVLRISPAREGVLRIQFGPQDARFAATSPMLAPDGLADEEALGAVEFREEGTEYVYRYGGYTMRLEKSPFCLKVISPGGETLFESETEKLVGLYTAPPLGLRRQGREAFAFLSWRMRNQDRWFGLGEKFNRFEKTGTRATIWEADTCGSNTTDMSYKAVPVIFSTAGWALMLHSSFRSFWELGSFSYATGGMLVEDSQLDLFLILAPSLKEQVSAYTALTGRPALPPRWAYGLWMSRAAYLDRAQLREVATRLRDEQIPCDVLNLDPSWMEHDYYNDIGVEVCNFNWDQAAWGKPEGLFEEFARDGFSLCLWINPYFSEDSPLYKEAKDKGYLVRTLDRSIARLELGLAAGILDFTNPAAKAWWQGKLADLLKRGASAFKVDFGDRVPEDALFSNGKNGREMHNLYVHLYSEAVFEALRKVKGTGIIWRRPGYIGSQRFPGCWAGDTQVTWEGMAGALRGGLSAAFTGEAFWSHDIGGFVGSAPSEELYIRWSQFGLLSPFARYHGTTPREPWVYGPRALEVARFYARLRYSLLPYLQACGAEAAASGLPILRPMVLEFPHEPRIDTIDDQYLLGLDLLVAPVIQAGVTAREVYFPRGQWWIFDRPGSAFSGGGYRQVEAPLERIPLYVRAGAVIPRYRQVPQHLKGPAPAEWLLDIYPADSSGSQRQLTIHEPGYTVAIHYRFENGAGRLEISPAPINVAVRLIDRRQPSLLRSIGLGSAPAAPLRPNDAQTNFTVDATHGAIVEFRV